MADDSAAEDIGAGDIGGESAAPKKGGLGGAISGLLKYILIGVAGVILVVTVAVITVTIMNKSGSGGASAAPVSVEYTTQRESYDWYTSLDQISTTTSDTPASSVVVQVVLGYKKDDKQASTEITERRIEIIDFLRRFFSEKTYEELRPQNEEVLRQQIRDQINDDILSNSRIRDVRFTKKDVVQQ